MMARRSGTPRRRNQQVSSGLEAVALQLFDLDIAQAQAPEEEQGLREPGVPGVPGVRRKVWRLVDRIVPKLAFCVW